MSEEAFKKAKGDLAFSQQLVDKFRAQQAPQQAQPQALEAPAPQEQPIQPPTEKPAQETQPAPTPEAKPKEKITDKLVGVIQDLVASKDAEEKQRVQELEKAHEEDMQAILDAIKGMKHGKK